MKKYFAFIIVCLLLAGNISAQKVPEQKTKPVRKKDEVFTFVEENPQFKGGDAAMIKFLQQNIRYPQMERDSDIQGKVLVRFVVDEKGKVRDTHLIRGVSPGLDAEAIRVVKLLPKFIPGKQQGKKVKVYFNLPIVFKLQ